LKKSLNKYKNKKVEYNGITFDSKDEMLYYQYLLGLQIRGIITKIELQPKVTLIPKFEREGKKYRTTTYTPDFLITYPDESQLYIDVKGYSTQQGELRRKLFAYESDIPLHWVARSKKYSTTGWIGYDELQKLRKANKKKAHNNGSCP
jgi:hypothetical protein